MSGKCRDCKFWRIEQPHYTYGDCHRLPPQTERTVSAKRAQYGDGVEVRITDSRSPIWPNTNEDDWCGEWSPDIRHIPSAPLPGRT